MGAGLWPGSLLSAQASTFEWFWKRGHRAEMLSPSAQWLPAMWAGGQTGHLGELSPEDKLSHGFHRYQGSCGGQATVGRATGLKPIHTIPQHWDKHLYCYPMHRLCTRMMTTGSPLAPSPHPPSRWPCTPPSVRGNKQLVLGEGNGLSWVDCMWYGSLSSL